ncbi:hypothetical protein AAB988_18600, partial [Burkholderia contaminans]
GVFAFQRRKCAEGRDDGLAGVSTSPKYDRSQLPARQLAQYHPPIPWPIASISDQSSNSSPSVSGCTVAREPLSSVDKIVELAMQALRSRRTEPPNFTAA